MRFRKENPKPRAFRQEMDFEGYCVVSGGNDFGEYINSVRKGLKTMRDSIIMTKYQGFGNDYLVLDAKKNQLQLQGNPAAKVCRMNGMVILRL